MPFCYAYNQYHYFSTQWSTEELLIEVMVYETLFEMSDVLSNKEDACICIISAKPDGLAP